MDININLSSSDGSGLIAALNQHCAEAPLHQLGRHLTMPRPSAINFFMQLQAIMDQVESAISGWLFNQAYMSIISQALHASCQASGGLSRKQL